jgi:hypothetical protein
MVEQRSLVDDPHKSYTIRYFLIHSQQKSWKFGTCKADNLHASRMPAVRIHDSKSYDNNPTTSIHAVSLNISCILPPVPRSLAPNSFLEEAWLDHSSRVERVRYH